jgi:hypothetical protein
MSIRIVRYAKCIRFGYKKGGPGVVSRSAHVYSKSSACYFGAADALRSRCLIRSLSDS